MKLPLTFLVVVLSTLLLSSAIYTTPLGHPITHLLIFLPLCSYVLWKGYRRNGEYENSVGTIFGIPTKWIIPSGSSFWFPTPIGGEVGKQSIQKQVLDRSSKSGQAFTQVKTADGGTAEVGIVQTSHIVDVTKTARFTPEELAQRILGLTDRNVRLFALLWDSDEDSDSDPTNETALANKKREMSRFLQGDTSVLDRDGKPIPNDTLEKLAEIGMTIDNVDVTDVNEPKEVQDARNKAAAENAEGEAEQRDIDSVRKRILELMWGTADETAIATRKAANESPLMTYQEALRTVRTARGDMEDINVSGDADGFTKGAALQRKDKKK